MRFCVLLLLAVAVCLSGEDEPVAAFGTTVVISSGLKGDIYHLPHSAQSVHEIEHLKPQGSIYTTSLNVSPQDFQLGFTGVTKRYEWFAIDYSGKFWIEHPGLYRFRLISDDGAMLYIDGQLVADNDGIHSTEVRLGSIRLAGGMHTIRVPYFQGPATTVALMLEIAGPDEQPRIFSTEEFKPPSNPEDWHFAPAAEFAPPDPDLRRIAPARYPGPEGSKVKKKKKK